MTFLEALYGSQYYEISQRGKDGAKGRFNGNIFLAVFVMLIILTIIALATTFSQEVDDKLTGKLTDMFGYGNGKAVGRLLAIPVIAILYFIISKTVGSERNYNRLIDNFNQLPEEEKKKANKKVLIPFFVVLIAFFIMMMSSLF